MLVDDKLLIPGEMSPWDAVEHLPDGLREWTRKAMQEKVGGVVMGLIKDMRERLLTELGDENQRAIPHPPLSSANGDGRDAGTSPDGMGQGADQGGPLDWTGTSTPMG